MMKRISRILCLGFLFISFSMLGQTRVEQIASTVDEVVVNSGLEVKIINGASESQISIQGDDRNDVKVKEKLGVLKLSLPIGQVFSDTDVSIVLSLKQVSKISANQGAEVGLQRSIQQQSLVLETSEGSLIAGEVDLEKLNAKAVTGGIFNLYGKAVSQEIIIKSGGVYDSKDVASEHTRIKVSYGGEAEVFASQTCDAKVLAGGTIKIYGKPQKCKQKTKFGGNIEVMK